MNRVNIKVEVVKVLEPKKITMGSGVKHDILELVVKDKTGTITLVVWDDKIILDLEIGCNLQILNGFVTSYRGEWRINIGKYGEIRRI